MTPPLLAGVDKGRCGRPFNFATCSINPGEWIEDERINSTLMRQGNGPCCSLGGRCGGTESHCVLGIDFREISEGIFILMLIILFINYLQIQTGNLKKIVCCPIMISNP